MTDDDKALEVLMDALMTGDTSGAIERQEARGQAMLVRSSILPKRGTIEPSQGDGPYRAEMERLGFTFGEDADDLFVQCQLPHGWELRPTDHSMWSRLYDEHGRERAAIFYKAAFYDRKAFVSWTPRYAVRRHHAATPDLPEDYNPANREEHVVCFTVCDAGRVIWHGAPYRNYDLALDEERREEARTWLTAHYPQHDNPFAYWQGEEADG